MENQGKLVYILTKGVELKIYNHETNFSFREIKEDIKTLTGMPIEKQVLYYKGRCLQSSQTLDFLREISDSNIVDVHLALKHSIGDKSQGYKIDPRLLNPFNVIFDFPETVVCKDLSLLTFSTTFDIKKYIEKEYKLPTDSQILSYNDKVLRNLYDLRELYYNNDEERFQNEVSINLIVKAENCEITSNFVSHAKEHNLSSILINTLTNQISINLAKENVWTVMDVKKFLEKQKKIQIRAQVLMHRGAELTSGTWLPGLVRNSLEKQLTLTLLIHKLPVEYKKFDLTSFSHLFTGDKVITLKSTETVATLKELINNATGVASSFIKVYSNGILFTDDRPLFELKSNKTDFRVCRIISVLIVDENGVEHQCNHVVDTFTKTVEDLRQELELSDRFTKGRKYLKFLETEVKVNDWLLKIDRNADIKFHVKCENFFQRNWRK